jgi:cell division protein FtsA
MAGVRDSQGQLVFGLDIGTRSIVGTVGYQSDNKFHILAQRSKEHETRAMLDGQIHDIGKVGESISIVKKQLEDDLGKSLSEVCIAAAGRVLRTVTTHVESAFEAEKEIDAEDIYNLSMAGVEQAYTEFQKNPEAAETKFYCVGYTPMRYYMNGYQMGNLEGHKAKTIGCDMIATFLPDDVVDGLYKSVELAGLHVANLTLEPIAAIQVAIPERFRLLNLALVDVGAGTSDISITRDGAIVAYGMIPTAGDALTEIVVQHYLVDFEEAEHIKRSACEAGEITFTDIMGLPQKTTSKEVLDLLDAEVDVMTTQVAEEIMRLNGDKAVSAAFVVGGGGMIPGYTEKLSQKLGILKERVAIRGEEVMQNLIFEIDNARKDAMMVTPIGICLSYYAQSNNFIFVEFNGERLKLYDNGRLSVSDAAIQVAFPNEDLFPKRGDAITCTVNGKSRIIRGEAGEAAVITINGDPADLYAQIGSGDIIKVVPSTMGEAAHLDLGELAEMANPIRITINGKVFDLPRTADVNGKLESAFYSVKDGDNITVRNYYTVEQICEIVGWNLTDTIRVNDTPAVKTTKVYEEFSLDLEGKDVTEEPVASEPETETVSEEESKPETETAEAENVEKAEEPASEETEEEPRKPENLELHVVANGIPVTLKGKPEYVFVDVFDYIHFDLSQGGGRAIVTNLNGEKAQYMEILHEGDVIEVYWS